MSQRTTTSTPPSRHLRHLKTNSPTLYTRLVTVEQESGERTQDYKVLRSTQLTGEQGGKYELILESSQSMCRNEAGSPKYPHI
jgi:hypothetical protein